MGGVGGDALARLPQLPRRLVVLGLAPGDEVVDEGAHEALAERAAHELAVVGGDVVAERLGPAPPQLLAVVAQDEGDGAHPAAPRAMSAAVAPAPTPLSMFTTASPGLQLCSMPMSAASPRPPKP